MFVCLYPSSLLVHYNAMGILWVELSLCRQTEWLQADAIYNPRAIGQRACTIITLEFSAKLTSKSNRQCGL